MNEELEAARLGYVINQIALGPADLERLLLLSEQTARDALVCFTDEDWRASPLASTLLGAAMSLRHAGMRPSLSVIEAMERFVAVRRDTGPGEAMPSGSVVR